MGWGINPAGFTKILRNFQENYGNPKMYITENGCAIKDIPNGDGYVCDRQRIMFIQEHLVAIHDAIQGGANVNGYYVWTLMDNFEWAHGFFPRFGLVRTDPQTGKRIPKESAFWYGEAIAKNGV